MSRRNAVRTVSFSLSVALVCLGFFYKTNKENKAYILNIENTYSYMLDELNTATGNIATILNKTRFVTTKPQINRMASKLLTEAEVSKSTLAQLPVAERLSSLNLFFSQVGNYAYSLSERIDEEGLLPQDTANIEKLSEISQNVAELLNSSRDNYNNLEYWAATLDREISQTVEEKGLSVSLTELEDEFKDYPTLIYDGPYSDHILNKESVLLKESAEISRDEALKNAVKYSSTGDIEFAGESQGKIPTLDFISAGLNIGITKQGGYLLYLRKEREIADVLLSYEQSLLKAKAYLESIGMRDLKETYYSSYGGVCVINFAFLDGKTICYTDLVKVGVAEDNGEIVFYEAGGYLANHKARAFATPQITEEEAESIISSKLQINEVRLALIPTDSEEEKRCYEFSCTSADSQEVLVYINTAALKEEEILILQKGDGQILVK